MNNLFSYHGTTGICFKSACSFTFARSIFVLTKQALFIDHN